MNHTLRILSLFLLFTLSGCNKDDDGGGDVLPPATQTGANTFGCYIDGKPFVSKDLDCFYQYSNGIYHFTSSGKNNDLDPIGVRVSSSESSLTAGQTYLLDGTISWGGHILGILNQVVHQF